MIIQLKKTGTYIHKHIHTHYSAIKRQNLVICNNMDGPWGYYVKWNKSNGERQIWYDFTYMWNMKKLINENKINKPNQTNTNIDKETSGGYWSGRGKGRVRWVKGMNCLLRDGN